MLRLKTHVPVKCFHRGAFVDRVNDDVLPFTRCVGVDVRCSKRTLLVTAICPKDEVKGFQKMLFHASRKPILAGRKGKR